MTTLAIICDNRPYAGGLIPSWGLSVGIKEPEGWTLFDLGNDPEIFLRNFTTLGGSLEDVRRIIISHRHQDHTGGFEAFRDIGHPIALYLPEPLSRSENATLTAWGLEPGVVAPEGLSLDNLSIFPISGGTPPEQLIVLERGGTLVLLTGCAHFGIENGLARMWDRFRRPFELVCGGFHFAFRPRRELARVLRAFQEIPVTRIAPCHCTGDEAITEFSRAFPDKFLRVGTGWKTTLDPQNKKTQGENK